MNCFKKFLSSGGAPTHHCFLDMEGSVYNHSTGQVPERLAQIQYEAENKTAITKLLGGGTVMVNIQHFWR